MADQEDEHQRRPGRRPEQGSPEYRPPQYGAPQYGARQYGQPQEGQPQEGQPQDGQPQYGQPQYGQPQYGQPQYGQPQYGQSQYGQYGQSQYGQDEYGGTPYGQQPYPGAPQYPGQWPPQYPESSQGVLALVLGIVGLFVLPIVAPFAWVIGNREVRGVDEGRRDPSNRGLGTAGKVMGIIGTCVLVLGTALLVAALLAFTSALPNSSNPSDTVGPGTGSPGGETATAPPDTDTDTGRTSSTSPPKVILVTVPNVTGMPHGEARTLLRQAGFVVREDYVDEPVPDLCTLCVVSTSPGPGTARKGSTVRLHLNPPLPTDSPSSSPPSLSPTTTP